jgi:aspartate-semialdehyde dehydrogenase
MPRETKPLVVAVVGATGVVGKTMIKILSEREFPVSELRLLASGRSAGTTLTVDGRTLTVGEATPDAFEGVDIALFSAGGDVSRRLAPEAAVRGATVIDNSNGWRMDPAVPLIVSQVNPDDGEWHEGIISNPNCSTMQLVPVLMALRDTAGIERVVVDTYQSVSGTGAEAVAELEAQIRAHVAGEEKVASVYPHPIAFNVLPEIDVFLENGYTREEWKVLTESRKILHMPELRLSCTAVRVPVFVSHSEAVHVETTRPMSPQEARRVFGRSRRHCDGRSGDPPLSDCRASDGDGRDLRRPRPHRSLGRTRSGVLGRQRQRPQGCRDERRPDRRDPDRAQLGRGSLAPRIVELGRGANVTEAERRAALDAIAQEVAVCTRCRLHQTRTRAVPGEGHPETEVVMVGEGPGFNEDRQGRPFVGQAGAKLDALLTSVGWRRDEVFITNVVKCRPPENRDPEPDEIAACAPFLTRQLEVLDPALVVTLGRFSMARFSPGARIGQVHGTYRQADPASGAPEALLRHCTRDR